MRHLAVLTFDKDDASSCQLHLCGSQPPSTQANSAAIATQKAKAKESLVEAFHASEAATATLVKLLSTDNTDSVHAVLDLLHACVERGGINDGHFNAGLLPALRSLCMLLPTSLPNAYIEPLTLVIKLMSTQMVQAAPGGPNAMDVDDPHGASYNNGVSEGIHQAVRLLLHESQQAASSTTCRVELQIELLNFLNAALTLHEDETLETLTTNGGAIAAVAQLIKQPARSDVPDGIPGYAAEEKAARLPAAASLLLATLLRRVRDDSRRRTALVEHLSFAEQEPHGLTLTDLMAGVRSSSVTRCAAALHLTAEMIDARLLSPHEPATVAADRPPLREAQQSLLAASHAAAARKNQQSDLHDDDDADAEGWQIWLLSSLLNLTIRREEVVLNGLHCVAASLSASPAGTRAANAFDQLAHHPWHRFALEQMHQKNSIRTPGCALPLFSTGFRRCHF